MSDNLQHRDWLLSSTEKFINTIDPLINVNITNAADGGKRLTASNISEKTIENCVF